MSKAAIGVPLNIALACPQCRRTGILQGDLFTDARGRHFLATRSLSFGFTVLQTDERVEARCSACGVRVWHSREDRGSFS